MPETAELKRPIGLAIFLIVAGVIGWIAAFALTVEKFELLINPQEALGCDFSVLVQCRANLESWQGSLFGFPNPIIGLGAWIAPIIVGAALLAGARFDRWFWIAFNIGVAGAFAFILWLAYQSIFTLSTLCVWCMLVWVVVIPMFWTVTLRNASAGVFGARLEPLGERLYGWVPAISVLGYIIIAVVAQLRLDVLATL